MNGAEKGLVRLLLLATFFKGLLWSGLIPIWHAPDEQAHFAQVQYYAELRRGITSGNDLSEEVFESERVLGTLRDERGINRFTYHPEYNIPYTDSLVGIHEEAIAGLGRETRTNFVKQEAARYPPLYYILASLGYLAGYHGDLFVRVFITRLISVLLAVASVWMSFRLARSIFPRQPWLSVSSAVLVAFHPMYTFVSSGVNNDVLVNLLSLVLLWIMVDAVRNGIKRPHILGMGATLGLGILTKQLIYPFLPLPLLVIGYWAVKRKSFIYFLRKSLPLIMVALLFGGIVFLRQMLVSQTLPYWPQVSGESPRYSLTVLEYLTEKLPQLYRETLPWYWGVFKWLGVVLPINVLRTIKVVLALAGLGLVQYAARRIRSRTMATHDWQLLLLVFVSIWYAFWLLAWDYMLIRSIGFSHGIQGRNFFPTIAAHLTLMMFGLSRLSKRHRRTIIKLAVLGMIILNFIALRTMLSSYYELTPLSRLIIQASQYKPWWFRDGFLVFWGGVYLAFLAQFINRFLTTRRQRP